MKKEKKIDIRFSHQLDLLEKYFEVDRENKIIEIKFKYDKPTDALDEEISSTKKPLFKKEVLETISEYLNMLPTGYKANIDILFDDMEGYNPEEITESLNDYLELNSYQIFRESKKKWLIASLLIFFGIMILVLKINLGMLSLLSDYAKSIFEEVVDIAAWVFIWEAVTVLFLSPSDLLIYGIGLLKKINVIKLGTENNYHTQTKEEIIEKWQYDSKTSKVCRVLWLASSVFLMALATSDLISTLILYMGIGLSGIFFVTLVANSLTFLLGLSGLLSYVGKNKLNLIMKIFGAIFALVSIGLTGVGIYMKESSIIFTYSMVSIFTLIIVILPKNKIR